ncbi:hypothetical protein QBC37DRAFT_416422, partial [Rhypophila decipiens]
MISITVYLGIQRLFVALARALDTAIVFNMSGVIYRQTRLTLLLDLHLPAGSTVIFLINWARLAGSGVAAECYSQPQGPVDRWGRMGDERACAYYIMYGCTYCNCTGGRNKVREETRRKILVMKVLPNG